MDATLLRLRGQLHPFVVADRIGVSPSVMYRRLRELGVQLRRCVRQKKGATAGTVAPVYHQTREDHEHA